jgi:phosphatidylglycerophosphate synthase
LIRKLSPLAQLYLCLVFGAVLMTGIAIWLVGLNLNAIALSFSGYAVGSLLTIALMRKGFPHALLGMGNVVTLIRLALVAALISPLLANPTAGVVVAVALASLLLDGVDGWLARRESRVSSFGARLDIEVDSAFAMVLALNSWVIGTTGPLIILLALPRYIYVAFAKIYPWLNKQPPTRIGGKVVGVIQILALISFNLPNFPQWLVIPVVAIVLAGLIWSFGRDVRWLWRSR